MEGWTARLFSKLAIPKGKRREVALMAPVAGRKEAEGLFRALGKQMFKDYDVLLIFPEGNQCGLGRKGGLLVANERGRLGTSGCFFSGQALLYSLGYEVIISADHDALLSSPGALGSLVGEAKRTGKLCVYPSACPGGKPEGNYFVANQYGAYPRSALEGAGFITPYMWRGGEDWEVARRYGREGMLKVCAGAHAIHPYAGGTVYHKMAQGRKFYPYVCGLMRAMLFLGGARYNAMFALWHAYYRFFAFAFGEQGLSGAVLAAPGLAVFEAPGGKPQVKVEENGNEARQKGAAKAAVEVFAILPLALFGRASFGNVEVIFSGPRLRLLARACAGALLSPFFALEGLWHLSEWRKERGKVAYPIFPKDLPKAAADYAKMVEKGSL